MNDDELRELIASADPSRSQRASRARTPRDVTALVDRVVETEALPVRRSRRGARVLLVAGAAASFALVFIAVQTGIVPQSREPSTSDTLALRTRSANATALCTGFNVDDLRSLELAFSATAVMVDGATAKFKVEHWYKGGEADEVTLTTLTGPDRVEFSEYEIVAGQKYLVAASNGLVEECGFSGPHTPELQRGYEAAFD